LVVNGLGVQQVVGRGTLILTDDEPTGQHNGVYQCFASNQFGTAVGHRIHLRRASWSPFFSGFIIDHFTVSVVSVVRALDLRLDAREFDSRPPELVSGWMTVFGQANHLGISLSHLGQLSLLPSAGREMSDGQSAAMLCGWGVKERRLLPYVDKRVAGRQN